MAVEYEIWEFVDKDFCCEIPECKTMTRLRCQSCWSTICQEHMTIDQVHDQIFLYCPACTDRRQRQLSYGMLLVFCVMAIMHIGESIFIHYC
jgi:hypothetical protein